MLIKIHSNTLHPLTDFNATSNRCLLTPERFEYLFYVMKDFCCICEAADRIGAQGCLVTLQCDAKISAFIIDFPSLCLLLMRRGNWQGEKWTDTEDDRFRIPLWKSQGQCLVRLLKRETEFISALISGPDLGRDCISKFSFSLATSYSEYHTVTRTKCC